MTVAEHTALASVEEVLEVIQYYMSAYDRGAAFECELLLLEALDAGVKLTFPLPVAALRGSDNWSAVRALSLALTLAP